MLTTKTGKTYETRNLRSWIATAGKFTVEKMNVQKYSDGSCLVLTRFSNGHLFSHRWASFDVFNEYMTKRSRNFKGVQFEVLS